MFLVVWLLTVAAVDQCASQPLLKKLPEWRLNDPTAIQNVLRNKEPAKVRSYDECVQGSAKAKEALIEARPECKGTAGFCSNCLGTYLDILDVQAACCEALQGPPDPGMRANAYDICTKGIPQFKAEEVGRCKGEHMPDSRLTRYKACRKDVIDAETAVYTAHPDCSSSRGTFCDTCYNATLGVADLMASCCELADGDTQACMAEAAEKRRKVRFMCQVDAVDVEGLDPAAEIAAATTCHDVWYNETSGPYATCLKNMIWAEASGFYLHPELYKQYPFLTAHDSGQKFQFMLFLHKGPSPGPSWGCPMPCSRSPAIQEFIKRSDAAVESLGVRAGLQQKYQAFAVGDLMPTRSAVVAFSGALVVSGMFLLIFLRATSFVFRPNDGKEYSIASERSRLTQASAASSDTISQPGESRQDIAMGIQTVQQAVPTSAVSMPMWQPVTVQSMLDPAVFG